MSGNQNSGRRPKPTALKILQGQPGHRPLNDAEPLPAPTAPDCPDWLSETAKEIWAATIDELRYMGTLAHSDAVVIAAFCQSTASWVSYQQVVDQTPWYETVFVDGSGAEVKKLIAHPAVKMAKDEKAAMRAFATLLGLDPSSRSRLKVTKEGAGGEGVLSVG